MDKEKKKRLQTWKIIISEAIMVITIIVLVIILIFLAMGYKLNGDGELDQSGLLRAESFPTGATVNIDGDELFFKTDMSHLVSEGQHHVALTKDGYESWEDTISITSGKLYRLDYPRLIKQDSKAEKVHEFSGGAPEFFSIAPDHKHLLIEDPKSHEWQFSILKDNELETISKLDFSQYIGDKITSLSWNKNSNRVVLESKTGDVDNFAFINLENPEKSFDLPKEFSLNFSKVKFSNDSGSRLLALENQNLREISVDDRVISRVPIDEAISDFVNDDRDVLFITKPSDQNKQKISSYRDGEKEPVKLKTIKSRDSKLSVSEYLGNKYLGLIHDQSFSVYKDIKEMNKVANKKLGFTPAEIYIHNDGRFIVARDQRNIAVFDSELENISEFKFSGEHSDWLDRFLLGDVDESNDLYIVDFNGANRRKVADSVSKKYENVISADNKWLYYISADGTKLKRKEL